MQGLEPGRRWAAARQMQHTAICGIEDGVSVQAAFEGLARLALARQQQEQGQQQLGGRTLSHSAGNVPIMRVQVQLELRAGSTLRKSTTVVRPSLAGTTAPAGAGFAEPLLDRLPLLLQVWKV